ncbi:MAG: FAD-dependent oxidoreductase, partial [Firmicutes bacterium]|nr:FAD-dependent oxidoreductase [Bacillota bacterium]
DVTIQQLRDEGFKGFYVAIGLQYGGKLNIPGEDAEGVMSGVDYIKTVNAGTAKPLSGNVVVIGGGNIGADVARTAVRQGASSVKLFCLEAYEDMPMGEEDQLLCKEDGVEINAGWGQTEVIVEDGKCAGIKFRKCLSVKNAEGRFDPQFDDSDTTSAECTTVLFCIGQKADWKELLAGTRVEFDRRGLAIVDPVTHQTAEPDIFAGGDAVSGQKFVVDALAMGREGAVSLHRFVNEGQSLTIHRNTRQFKALDKENIVLPPESYKKPARARKGFDPAKVRTMSDERLNLTEEQIQSEASRCLGCGRSVVDQNKCLGCGMCTVQCKFDAIHLVRKMGDDYSRMVPAEQKFVSIGKNLPKKVVKIVKNSITGKGGK